MFSQALEKLNGWTKHMQLEEEDAESAALTLALRLREKEQLPDFIQLCIPKRIRAQRITGQGLAHALVETALAEAAGKPLPGLLPRGILESSPERMPARQKRHALTVALGLEQSGQHREAVQAYRGLLLPPASRESLLAARQLTALALRLGRKAEVCLRKLLKLLAELQQLAYPGSKGAL